MQFSFPSSADAFTPAEDLSHFVDKVSHSENETEWDMWKTQVRKAVPNTTHQFLHMQVTSLTCEPTQKQFVLHNHFELAENIRKLTIIQ